MIAGFSTTNFGISKSPDASPRVEMLCMMFEDRIQVKSAEITQPTLFFTLLTFFPSFRLRLVFLLNAYFKHTAPAVRCPAGG
jgi:hypothetical protein